MRDDQVEGTSTTKLAGPVRQAGWWSENRPEPPRKVSRSRTLDGVHTAPKCVLPGHTDTILHSVHITWMSRLPGHMKPTAIFGELS